MNWKQLRLIVLLVVQDWRDLNLVVDRALRRFAIVYSRPINLRNLNVSNLGRHRCRYGGDCRLQWLLQLLSILLTTSGFFLSWCNDRWLRLAR